MATPSAPTDLWVAPTPQRHRVTKLRALAVVAVLAVLGVVLALTVFNGPTAAQRDCGAERTYVIRNGDGGRTLNSRELTNMYQMCLHAPGREPASYWQN